ncbi:SAM-dependent methyltransferase [Rhodocyclus tenuis]|uniref:tRNA (guanine(46)-N(7))-methyltransferase n=1 Tax=Rhodocyclus gracilis TaxID=2929842 RepID=A0ABX0WJ56_9RHOO|nr:SAM-dependent methyltransferase [Rhodocyclus gracilis]
MHANSRTPVSAQTDIHTQLPALLDRRVGQPFRQPIAVYNQRAFEEFLAAYRGFGVAAPLIVDACCGTGESSLWLARQHPECFVVGVDQSAIRLGRGTRQPLPANVLLLRADLVDFWRLLADAGLRPRQQTIFYPNPWPKIGHLARRWHAHAVFPTVLALGGVLECRSNWRIYIDEFAFAIKRLTGLVTRGEVWAAGEPVTAFERKYRDSGHTLYRLVVDLDAAPQRVGAQARGALPVSSTLSSSFAPSVLSVSSLSSTSSASPTLADEAP